MDPVSAISIAAACVAFIDFGAKFINLCKGVRDQGHVPGLEDSEANSKSLARIRKQLREPSHDHWRSQYPGLDEMAHVLNMNSKQIKDAATRCCNASDQLLSILSELQAAKKRGIAPAMKQVVKWMRQKREIEKLERALDRCRTVYDAAINHQVCSLAELDLLERRQDTIVTRTQLERLFDQLRLDNNNLITEHAQTRSSVNRSIGTEHTITRAQVREVGRHIDDMSRASKRKDFQKVVLDSLFFEEYRSRKEQVSSAHAKTFEWIYHEHNTASVASWSNFALWIEHGDGPYWIHGKAGSGKSTLCSFIVDHSQTHALLSRWSEAKKVVIVSFFFWRPGTNLQKSVAGALRSLLYQIVKSSLADLGKLLNFVDMDPTQIPEWTNQRLLEALNMTIKKSTRCFFVILDGLDEYAGELSTLTRFCHKIGDLHNVKLCVSSRSQQPFQRAFSTCDQLRLQDLNFNDIHSYVTSKLEQYPDLHQVCNDIIRDAQGIFVWAKLVTNTVVNAQLDGDDVKTITARVRECPQELHDLYKHLLRGIDVHRQEEATFYFRVANIKRTVLKKHIDVWTVSAAMKAFCMLLSRSLPYSEVAAPVSLNQLCRLADRIELCTKGLLEIYNGPCHCHNFRHEVGHSQDEMHEDKPADGAVAKTRGISTVCHYLTIDYMHRSAQEFVVEGHANVKWLEGLEDTKDVCMALALGWASLIAEKKYCTHRSCIATQFPNPCEHTCCLSEYYTLFEAIAAAKNVEPMDHARMPLLFSELDRAKKRLHDLSPIGMEILDRAVSGGIAEGYYKQISYPSPGLVDALFITHFCKYGPVGSYLEHAIEQMSDLPSVLSLVGRFMSVGRVYSTSGRELSSLVKPRFHAGVLLIEKLKRLLGSSKLRDHEPGEHPLQSPWGGDTYASDQPMVRSERMIAALLLQFLHHVTRACVETNAMASMTEDMFDLLDSTEVHVCLEGPFTASSSVHARDEACETYLFINLKYLAHLYFRQLELDPSLRHAPPRVGFWVMHASEEADGLPVSDSTSEDLAKNSIHFESIGTHTTEPSDPSLSARYSAQYSVESYDNDINELRPVFISAHLYNVEMGKPSYVDHLYQDFLEEFKSVAKEVLGGSKNESEKYDRPLFFRDDFVRWENGIYSYDVLR